MNNKYTFINYSSNSKPLKQLIYKPFITLFNNYIYKFNL